MIGVVHMLVGLQLFYLLLHVRNHTEQLTFLSGSSHPLFGFCFITLYPKLCLRDDLVKLLLSHINFLKVNGTTKVLQFFDMCKSFKIDLPLSPYFTSKTKKPPNYLIVGGL